MSQTHSLQKTLSVNMRTRRIYVMNHALQHSRLAFFSPFSVFIRIACILFSVFISFFTWLLIVFAVTNFAHTSYRFVAVFIIIIFYSNLLSRIVQAYVYARTL